ncbi:hypothetical protein AVEN_209768-1 [Araneus ventricosus]|uniref:Uncharacterized protein n=1 Tax=Araneus ventricosus TaxID=182803 RepID=A0A4Y2CCK7_ARAVE|nr:hypothetical protein AVEN_209768-1 [Araneus ventricosus]
MKARLVSNVLQSQFDQQKRPNIPFYGSSTNGLGYTSLTKACSRGQWFGDHCSKYAFSCRGTTRRFVGWLTRSGEMSVNVRTSKEASRRTETSLKSLGLLKIL